MESGPQPGGINRDDWLSALREADHADCPESDALTIAELGEILGAQRLATTNRVKRMIAAGTAVKTTKRIRRGDGAVITVTAYRLVK